MRKRIIFRADGNKTIGFGHVYRLLALADMLKDHFQCLFAINRPDELVRKRIHTICELIELNHDYTYVVPDLMQHSLQMNYDLGEWVNEGDIVVLDGYHFSGQYQHELKHRNCKQVMVDDMVKAYPFADMIINHAPGVRDSEYHTSAKCCLGLHYALLRKPFFSSFDPKPDHNTVYVSMGGSDIDGYSARICEALVEVKEIDHIHALCSEQFGESHLNLLRKLEAGGKITLHFNLDADGIVTLMAHCSKAVVSASTVMMEAYSRGLACYAVCTSENQERLYNGFVQNGFAIALGNGKELTAGTIIEKLVGEQAACVLPAPLESVSAHQKAFHEIAYDHA